MELHLDGHAVLHLTTVGRVTGRPHRIEIWFAHHRSTLYILSGGGNRSDWVRNIIANPEVTVSAGGADYVGRARIVVGRAEDRLARDMVFTKYSPRYGGDLTAWREEALPVAIDVADTDPRPTVD